MKKIAQILTKYFKKDKIYILVLAILAILTHLLWFNPGSTITNSDWGYYQQNVITELHQTFGTWSPYANFGGLNVQLPFYVFMSIWSLLGHLGLNYDAITKITFFIPIALLNFVSPYILLKSIFKDKNATFISALFYGTTTYGISNQPPLQLVYALAPLVLLLFRTAIKRNLPKDWLYFILLYSLGIVYEVRIMYIVTFILVIYFLLFHLGELKRVIWPLILTGGVTVLLNIYWLLPSSGSATASKINQVANRGLFGNNLFDMPHALTLSNWYWNGAVPNNNFVLQPIQPILWLIPILIIVGLPLAVTRVRLLEARKFVIFFLVVALLGITLTKQIAPPFSDLYPWLYAHFPGFNLFREASKFFVLTAFGYCGLIAATLVALKSSRIPNKAFYSLAVMAVVLVSLSNIKPLITGEIGGLFVARHHPEEYTVLNNFLAKAKDDFRTLWIPNTSRFTYQAQNKPAISGISAAETDWKAFSTSLEPSKQRLIFQSIMEPLFRPFSDTLFAAAGIKYVIVPLRDAANDDDFFQFYGNDREYFISLINTIPWLKRINIGTDQVAVYENQGYKPYIRAFTKVFNLQALTHLDEKYRFIKDTLGSDFNIASPDSEEPGVGLSDPFEAPTRREVSGGRLTTELTDALATTAYINKNHFTLSYRYVNGVLNFIRHDEVGLLADNQPIGPQLNRIEIIDKTLLKPTEEYLLAQGSVLTSIDMDDSGQHDLGVPTNVPVVYGAEAKNRVTNPQLKNGLWHPSIEDCNAFNDKAKISQELIKDVRWPHKVLQLKSSNHTACTGPESVGVSPGEKLMLAFDYRMRQGKQAGYELVWSGAKGTTTIRRHIVVSENSWRTERTLITAPAGATSLRVRFQAFPNDAKPIEGIARYTNVRISGLKEINTPPITLTPQYSTVSIPQSTQKLSISYAGLSGKNLIPNPSFELGPWQEAVGDCNAYDNKPDISMKLDSQNHSDGSHSLELAAKRHAACTGPDNIKVQQGHTYLLSFDYQSPNATRVNYHLGFNDPNFTQKGDDSIPIIDKKWHTYNRVFTVPYGATEASLAVYAAGIDPPTTRVINRYDNFRMIEIANVQGQYYLVNDTGANLRAPTRIDYTMVSPTKKLIHIRSAATPFYIGMNEAYHSQWRLELSNNRSHGGLNEWVPWAKPQVVSADNHFNFDDFLNGWYVDPAVLCAEKSDGCTINRDGSYDMELIAEFAPQRLFYLGRIISGVTLFTCVICLGWFLRKRWLPVYERIARSKTKK